MSRKSNPRADVSHSQAAASVENNTEEEEEELILNGMEEPEIEYVFPAEKKKRFMKRDEESFLGKRQNVEEPAGMAAISKKKSRFNYVKSQTPPTDYFESAPNTPQEQLMQSNMDNEQQYEAADNVALVIIYLFGLLSCV